MLESERLNEVSANRIDLYWWERKNPKEALRGSITAFLKRDLNLVAFDPETSFLRGVSNFAARGVARNIAKEMNVTSLHEQAEIVRTLKNAQMSVFVDELLLAFFEQEPVSPQAFYERIKTLMTSPKKVAQLASVYEEIYQRSFQDQRIQAEDEFPEEMLLRYHPVEYIRPDWNGKTKTSAEMAAETLSRMRVAIERGELIRTRGPKRGKNTIDADILLLRLPFVEVVVLDGGNDQLRNFEPVKMAKEKDIQAPETVQSQEVNPFLGILGEISLGDARISGSSIDGRFMITWAPEYTRPITSEWERCESVYEDLAHLRHELRHLVDHLLLGMNPARVNPEQFYFPNGTYPKNERSKRSVKEAISIETEHLLTEFKALSLDGRQLALSSYLELSIRRLEKYTVDGDMEESRIGQFWESWERLVDYMQDYEEFFARLDVPVEEGLRKISLIMYHCISTAESPEEVLVRLKHALAWIGIM